MTELYRSVPREHADVHILNALKTAFPTTKFTVRKIMGGGGDTYAVRWTDGPSWHEVNLVACALEASDVLLQCERRDGGGAS